MWLLFDAQHSVCISTKAHTGLGEMWLLRCPPARQPCDIEEYREEENNPCVSTPWWHEKECHPDYSEANRHIRRWFRKSSLSQAPPTKRGFALLVSLPTPIAFLAFPIFNMSIRFRIFIHNLYLPIANHWSMCTEFIRFSPFFLGNKGILPK